ncbi:hypothetical protein [Metabacillus malikii]|uniref:Quinol-cytochrome oxidoreductase complex cytochrome b subunit n=1 Tax=Metabacillus malikii TaxID=1504265 RepID=A0ABT9ZML4_9BACI|nr:hypothetical protein [Metabacillus malikii]MDQ0233149.1 quinol-cytochrome oxidoreductase complex cytochrome b subunit [Metabacillus malikii]
MSQFWNKHGRVITLVFFSIFMVSQIAVSFLAFEDVKTKLIMITIQVLMTSFVFFIAYKITKRILEKEDAVRK